MGRIVGVNGFQEWAAIAPRLAKEAASIIVYFYASIDPATGTSWCPDCRNGATGAHRDHAFRCCGLA